MSLRRSSRRLTVTGSTVFGGFTPQVSNFSKGNESVEFDMDSSPQWVSGEDAFTGLKTPKFPQPSRRTTMTRQNIFENPIAETDGEEGSGKFKLPGFFIPISPPGVKTRNRRASMVVKPKGRPSKAKINDSTADKVTSKTKPKTNVVQKNTIKRATMSKVPVKQSTTTGFSEDNTQTKRSRRSTRFSIKPELEPLPENNLNENDAVVSLSLSNAETIFMTNVDAPRAPVQHSPPLTNLKEKLLPAGDAQEIHNRKSDDSPFVRLSDIVVTPKVAGTLRKSQKFDSFKQSLQESTGETTTITETVVSTPHMPRSNERKRLISKEEDQEIDSVVKKMISLSPKGLKDKQKHTSPNPRRTVGSPARVALVKEGIVSERKLKVPKEKQPLTPSRAAPKARQILGVTNTPLASNRNTDTVISQASDNVDEKMCSGDITLDSSIEIATENDPNLTLSHTSHSQWCTIL